ncbi:MAG: hypothetical protein ACKN9T_04275 [Candidatus Methylumidiphilus sp.]
MNTQATPEIRSNSNRAAADVGIPAQHTPETHHTAPRRVPFALSETGYLDLGSDTGLSALLEIGALLRTTRFDSKHGPVPCTDRRGLAVVANAGDEILEALLGGLGVVGKLLVHASGDMSHVDLAQAGWLIAGLADIAQGIHQGVADVKYALAQQVASEGEDSQQGGAQ